jgi:hypothetical protein
MAPPVEVEVLAGALDGLPVADEAALVVESSEGVSTCALVGSWVPHWSLMLVVHSS